MTEQEIMEKGLPETEITRMKIEKIFKYEEEAKKYGKSSMELCWAFGAFLGITMMLGDRAMAFFKGDFSKFYYLISTAIMTLCTGITGKNLLTNFNNESVYRDKAYALREELGMPIDDDDYVPPKRK